LFKYLERDRERLKEAWAGGSFSGSFSTEMIAKNAGATGACSAISDVLSVESDDLYDAIGDS
jgi:hypothetical protein